MSTTDQAKMTSMEERIRQIEFLHSAGLMTVLSIREMHPGKCIPITLVPIRDEVIGLLMGQIMDALMPCWPLPISVVCILISYIR
jgi:hypothetical protein